jgi:hypothetical protein
MFLTADQRFAISMRMLGIVEGIANLKPPTPQTAPTRAKHTEDNSDDEAINAMINEQLRSAGADFMNSEE